MGYGWRHSRNRTYCADRAVLRWRWTSRIRERSLLRCCGRLIIAVSGCRRRPGGAIHRRLHAKGQKRRDETRQKQQWVKSGCPVLSSAAAAAVAVAGTHTPFIHDQCWSASGQGRAGQGQARPGGQAGKAKAKQQNNNAVQCSQCRVVAALRFLQAGGRVPGGWCAKIPAA
jgi:hypothetical protein